MFCLFSNKTSFCHIERSEISKTNQIPRLSTSQSIHLVRNNNGLIISSILLSLYFIWSFPIMAQNLEKIGKKDMLKINGGVNINAIFYNANGINERRDPFNYFLSGNLNISVLDFNIPLTYSYSNQSGQFTQPFNRLSLTPYYKKIKTYIGYNSITFSPYTLVGYVFLGGGVEATPGKWKIIGLYGRFRKAVEFDNNNSTAMSFKRMGYGLKIGYENKGHCLSINYFTAKDDPNSVEIVPINSPINPESNSSISIQGKTTLLKNIFLEGEYAVSGYTKNTLSASDINLTNNKLPFFQENANTQYFNAYKSSIGYKRKYFGIQFQFEHVDPDYKTLGAYYFNNDLENYTLAPTFQLLKGKLNISLNSGVQRNNLNDNKMSTTKRWVNAFTASYSPNQKWIFNGMYSNFTSFTKNKPITTPLNIINPQDTLNFYQLSQNANASLMHLFGKQNRKQSINVMVSYMVTAQATGNFNTINSANQLENSAGQIYNANVAYNINFVSSKSNLSFILNGNRSYMQNINTLFYGPGINFGKSMFNNLLSISLGSTYNTSIINSSNSGNLFNYRFGMNYFPKFKRQNVGKISLSTNAYLIQRFSINNSFSEFTGTLNVGYTF